MLNRLNPLLEKGLARTAIMSKRPTDDLEPAAKKRGNSRQLTKDDPSDEEVKSSSPGCRHLFDALFERTWQVWRFLLLQNHQENATPAKFVNLI